MKNQSILSLFLIATFGFVISSCDLVKEVKYQVTPNPLEMHGDSVKISVTGTFPQKGIKKKAKAEIVPMLGNTELEPVVVLGEKATGNGKRIMYKPGGKFEYEQVIKYKPEFEVAELKVTGRIFKGSKEKEKITPLKIADGTIITPLLAKKEFKIIMSSDNFQRVTEKKFKAQINFDKAKSNVKPTELTDSDMFELTNWLKAAETNPKITIKSIQLTGFASPEGEVGSNSNLSSDRATSAKTSLLELAKKIGNTKAQSEIYNLAGSGEDWDGFKVELEKSDMNADEKALIIRVLEMYQDPVQREIEIKNMAKTFVYLEKNILPKLRRTEITILYDQIGYSDEELISLSNTNSDKLTVEELLFTATLLESLDEKLRIYNEASNYFPLDIRTHNNAGAIMYLMGNLADAGYKFEAANSLEDNAVSKNNIGAIEATQGNKEKARQLFQEASSAGSEVNFNLAYYDILENKYAQAISKYGTDDCFNKALAELLNGSVDTALKTIDNSKDKETALGYYLKAIAAARQNNVDNVVLNLKNSFEKDANFKAKAGRDREFLKFAANSTFMNVIK
jgi:outer membrane protein OmpA-like peptidoglycan-associated protein/tetratricopeptide (TPR) repeat protein